jgi:Fe-S cluster assembly ATP-binding protein
MLIIKNLHASIAKKEILRGINLEIKAGEVHAIMGPNGSGKSTLANILSGNKHYEKITGNITFLGKDLLQLPPEERALHGLFLAFQYPVEIAGVNNMYFLKTICNTIRKFRGEPELDAFDFMSLLKTKSKIVEIDDNLLQRAVNTGFSGGEKKRNEILQMLLLEPKLAILDEPDSGLDIDALQLVANGINSLRNKERGILLITHYQRLLNYVTPNYVHVMTNGQIVKSGGRELAQELEQKGYGWL